MEHQWLSAESRVFLLKRKFSAISTSGHEWIGESHRRISTPDIVLSHRFLIHPFRSCMFTDRSQLSEYSNTCNDIYFMSNISRLSQRWNQKKKNYKNYRDFCQMRCSSELFHLRSSFLNGMATLCTRFMNLR